LERESGFGFKLFTTKRGEREKPEPEAVWDSAHRKGGLVSSFLPSSPPVLASSLARFPAPRFGCLCLPPPSTSTADPPMDGNINNPLHSPDSAHIYPPRRPLRPVRHRAAGPCLACSGPSCRRAFRQDPTAAAPDRAVSPCHAGSGRREQGGGAQDQGGALARRRRRQGPRLVQEVPPPPEEGRDFPVSDAEAVRHQQGGLRGLLAGLCTAAGRRGAPLGPPQYVSAVSPLASFLQ
jgi:hypothetical protein